MSGTRGKITLARNVSVRPLVDAIDAGLRPRSVGLPANPRAKHVGGTLFFDAPPSVIPFHVHTVLKGAMVGAAKIDPLIEPKTNSCILEAQLADNDVEKLKDASTGSGPLRSFTTALAACEKCAQAPNLPNGLASALKTVSDFYLNKKNTLVQLGNAQSFSAEKRRSEEEVSSLIREFREGRELLTRVSNEFKKTVADNPPHFTGQAETPHIGEDDADKRFWGSDSRYA